MNKSLRLINLDHFLMSINLITSPVAHSSYVYSGSFTMKLLGFHDFSLDQSEELGIPEWTAMYVSTEVRYISAHFF